MSATFISTPIPRRAAPRPSAVRISAATYRRRRIVVGLSAVIVALVLAVAIAALGIGLLAGLGSDPASASGAQPALIAAPEVYVARPGDTLWSIAEDFHGEIGFDSYLRALIDDNGGTAIQSGQAIRLP